MFSAEGIDHLYVNRVEPLADAKQKDSDHDEGDED
jgi:hypothetical protein